MLSIPALWAGVIALWRHFSVLLSLLESHWRTTAALLTSKMDKNTVLNGLLETYSVPVPSFPTHLDLGWPNLSVRLVAESPYHSPRGRCLLDGQVCVNVCSFGGGVTEA